MLTEDGTQQLIRELFVPAFAEKLRCCEEGEREALLKEEIAKGFARMPPYCHEKAREHLAKLSEEELRVAREFCEYKVPLMDGSAIEMGLPYNWYYGVGGEAVGGKAPRFIMQRIAFAGLLVRAYSQTRDMAFAEALRHYLVDYVSRYWVDTTALPERDNWLCTSCRCGSWYSSSWGGMLLALRELHGLPCFSFGDLLQTFRAISNMMTGLIPNLALGSNWRVFELTNLFAQGLAYPFLRDGAYWLELACNGLNEEFEIQFRDDGSHEELCMGYGGGVWACFADFYVLVREAPQIGLSFSADKMRRAAEYYIGSCKPFGLLAALGDVYAIRTPEMLDGRSPPRRKAEPIRWAGAFARAAQALQRVEDFAVTRFVCGGPSPEWQSRFNPCSGYLSMRDGWHNESLYAHFNMGYYANCHCHYGLLGIEIAGLGREFVVDPGNSSLDPRPINQNFARTRAHSTLSVDDLDQQVAVPIQTSRCFTGEAYDFAVGVYKGGWTLGNPYGCGCTSAGQYEAGFSGSHFRHLLFVKGSYWVLFDALTTHPGHTAQTRLQFLPNAMKVLPGGGYATGWDEANLALLPLHWDGWAQALLQGQEDPIEGWVPGAGGALLPAPVYKATCPTGPAPCWHGSLLFPFREAELPPVTVTSMAVGDAGFGYRIETDAYTDYIFLSNSWSPRPIVMDGIETDAACLHLRMREGAPTQAFTCEGSHLRVDGREVFHAPGTMLAREFRFEQGVPAGCTVRNPRRAQRLAL